MKLARTIPLAATWFVLISALTLAPSSALACGIPLPTGPELLGALAGMILGPLILGFLIFLVLAHIFR